MQRLDMLDRWRGISIVLVLIAHLIPLTVPVNTLIGMAGMALFFALSGFLITSFLLKKDVSVIDFLARRFFRIIPLVWLYLFIVFLFQTESMDSWLAHFFFYANLPPKHIRLATDHLWSLCVEVQFYIGIAILFALFRKRGLILLPFIGLFFTFYRVWNGVYVSSISWFRADEILAGCWLALLYHGQLGGAGKWVLQRMKMLPQGLLVVLFLLSCLYGVEYGLWLNYFRPYLAVLLIGATLVNPEAKLASYLNHRILFYLATVSYALYVIHIGLVNTWLGSGDFLERYSKRPLLLIALFFLAHLSTFHFEHHWIALGKSLSSRFRWSGEKRRVS